jgi:hypothetical protein
MSERDVAWSAVLRVLNNTEVSYSNTHAGAHAGKTSEVRQADNLYVVVSTKPDYDRHDTDRTSPMYAVITVGLRSQDQWTNEDARRRAQKEETVAQQVITMEHCDNPSCQNEPRPVDKKGKAPGIYFSGEIYSAAPNANIRTGAWQAYACQPVCVLAAMQAAQVTKK